VCVCDNIRYVSATCNHKEKRKQLARNRNTKVLGIEKGLRIFFLSFDMCRKETMLNERHEKKSRSQNINPQNSPI